jgi:hypothetical protein
MSPPRVSTFFYGSFINPHVLKQSGFSLEQYEVAKLPGFDIQIQPLANLVQSDEDSVYGILVQASHEELTRLYSQGWVGTYLPEPVLVQTTSGAWRPAFCYIAPAKDLKQAADDYIDRIVGPARAYGFPDWYIARIERFRPGRK